MFVEVSDAVQDSLVAFSSADDLVKALSALDAGDLHHVMQSLQEDVLNQPSLAFASNERSAFEDAVATPWQSARNRWLWLGVNLLTAFVASRIIGRAPWASSCSSAWRRRSSSDAVRQRP